MHHGEVTQGALKIAARFVAAVTVMAGASAAHAAPGAGLAVGRLAVDTRLASIAIAGVGDTADLPLPKTPEGPGETAKSVLTPAAERPDMRLRKIVGYSALGASVVVLIVGVQQVWAVSPERRWPLDAGIEDHGRKFFALMLTTPLAAAAGATGAGLLYDANGVDWAFNHPVAQDTWKTVATRAHYRSAKMAGLIGAGSTALGVGGLLFALNTEGEFGAAAMVPATYLIEVGVVSAIIGVAHLRFAEDLDPAVPKDAKKGPSEIGFGVVPLNGGLAAGFGMRF